VVKRKRIQVLKEAAGVAVVKRTHDPACSAIFRRDKAFSLGGCGVIANPVVGACVRKYWISGRLSNC
jgi:hypothetical protein